MAKKTPQDFKKEIQLLDKEVEQQKADSIDIYYEPTDQGTRQRIARLFVVAYFGLLAILIVGVPIYNLVAYKTTGPESSLQISLTDIIQTYSAIVGPTLGFVIGYYFKTRGEDK